MPRRQQATLRGQWISLRCCGCQGGWQRGGTLSSETGVLLLDSPQEQWSSWKKRSQFWGMEHHSDSNQTNWGFIQNNSGFVRRLRQPDKSHLKRLPFPANFYPPVPVTLRHRVKRRRNYAHKPHQPSHVTQRLACCPQR